MRWYARLLWRLGWKDFGGVGRPPERCPACVHKPHRHQPCPVRLGWWHFMPYCACEYSNADWYAKKPTE